MLFRTKMFNVAAKPVQNPSRLPLTYHGESKISVSILDGIVNEGSILFHGSSLWNLKNTKGQGLDPNLWNYPIRPSSWSLSWSRYLVDQRRIRRSVLRLETLDGIDITSIADDDGVLLELFELRSHGD